MHFRFDESRKFLADCQSDLHADGLRSIHNFNLNQSRSKIRSHRPPILLNGSLHPRRLFGHPAPLSLRGYPHSRPSAVLPLDKIRTFCAESRLTEAMLSEASFVSPLEFPHLSAAIKASAVGLQKLRRKRSAANRLGGLRRFPPTGKPFAANSHQSEHPIQAAKHRRQSRRCFAVTYHSSSRI